MKKKKSMQKPAERKRAGTDVAWQNKDITAKSLAESFRGKTFAVYGIDVPEIKEELPTNLPVIEANELRLDNLFLLGDGSYAIVDYESEYDEANKKKYLGYIARVASRLYNETGRYVLLRVIIIYTADVEPRNTKPLLDMGALTMSLTEAFLVKLDSDRIYKAVYSKVWYGQKLDDEELMKLIIYPLTFKGVEAKQEAIHRAVGLIEKIADDQQRRFAAKYLWVFTDKVITDEEIRRIESIMSMTRIEKYFIDKKTREIAENLLKDGIPVEVISRDTGLSLEEVVEIQEGILQQV